MIERFPENEVNVCAKQGKTRMSYHRSFILFMLLVIKWTALVIVTERPLNVGGAVFRRINFHEHEKFFKLHHGGCRELVAPFE